MKKFLKTFYKNKRGQIIEVIPCYCGGYIHSELVVKRNKLVSKIINCYRHRKSQWYTRIKKEEALNAPFKIARI